MLLLGYMLVHASGVWGVIISNDTSRYLTCIALNTTVVPPDVYVEWYWKVVPLLLYGIGRTICNILLYEFMIAQSPDKMKGLVFGLMLAFRGSAGFILQLLYGLLYTLCYDMVLAITFVLLFVIFLFLCKWYTLCERNKEVNIQATVEEHYERYMDQ